MIINNIAAPFAFMADYFARNYPLSPNCPMDLPLSCRNETVIPDTCCFEYPGGVFLQTQFWDYKVSHPISDKDELERRLGPLNDFTIHGLWPDNCDGGYQQFCDNSAAIDDVYYLLNSKQFNGDHSSLEISGKDLLAKLKRLWKSNTGDDESLWIHEYNKHGTCIKTIKPECYKRWNPKSEQDLKKQSVYDYFRIAYNLYKSVNTSAVLKERGIVPTTTDTYTRDEIERALSDGFDGKRVFFACDGFNAINEIWYYHILKGSLLGEEFVKLDSLYHGRSRCPETGIKFLPKGYMPPNNRAPKFRGIIRMGGMPGELIRNGHWMIGKTAAQFSLIESEYGGYLLRSNAGYCGFQADQQLSCQKSLQQAAQFEYEDGYIGYSGAFQWGAYEYPQHSSQSVVYHDPERTADYNFKLKFIKK